MQLADLANVIDCHWNSFLFVMVSAALRVRTLLVAQTPGVAAPGCLEASNPCSLCMLVLIRLYVWDSDKDIKKITQTSSPICEAWKSRAYGKVMEEKAGVCRVPRN